MEQYRTAGQATDENITLRRKDALCRPETKARIQTHTPIIFNTYCFSTATMLRERASMLRYTYIAYLVMYTFFIYNQCQVTIQFLTIESNPCVCNRDLASYRLNYSSQKILRLGHMDDVTLI